MRAAYWLATTWLLGVAVVIGAAVLPGCSTARGPLLARNPRTRPTSSLTQRFDLANPSSGPVRRDVPIGPVDATSGVMPSPDGKWVAFESDEDGVHGVWVARPDGEQAHRVSRTRVALQPRWSPDAARLMFLGRDVRRGGPWNIWIVESDTASARKLTAGGGVPDAGASWFPDSRHICYGSGNWLVVVDTDDDTTRSFRLPDDAGRIVGVPAVSPDNRRVVFAVDAEGAWLVSLADGAMTQIIAERDVDAFAWAPGGRQIAFRTGRDGQWKVRIVK